MNVVIVGGGISGLAVAYYLDRQASAVGMPLSRIVVEGAPRPGGKILTRRSEGFVLEGGPDSLLTRKPAALALCAELGLTDRLIAPRPAVASTRILHRGQLVPLPEGTALIAPTRLWPFVRTPLLSWRGKVRAAWDLVIPPRRDGEDESVGAFIRRRLGKEFLDVIAEPLLGGIHAGDPERLSLYALFPGLVELERQYGSLIRGSRVRSREAHQPCHAGRPAVSLPGDERRPVLPPAFVSFSSGMAELIEALTARLGAGSLILGRRVERVSRRAEGADSPRYAVVLDDYRWLPADAVVLATPAYVSADLVEPIDPALASALRRIRYVSTAVVSLGYRRADVPRPWGDPAGGHGFVVPRREGRRINACTWSSAKFDGRAPGDWVLLRAFLGGTRAEEVVELDDDQLVKLVRSELADILGIVGRPLIVDIVRWPRGIPQYDVGHLERVAELEHCRPVGLYLTGAAYHGVGIPDCIAAAQLTAAAVIRDLVRAAQDRIGTSARWGME
ncbi:MAG: protoporphyrinogen oxidase [Chloroflexi bacterium]|nr:protoporphyrinogen oxidase [Chloroflexota bacterium]